MVTLTSFKNMHNNGAPIQLMKSERTGQQFATTADNSKVFLSKKADTTKALFVIENDGSLKPELKGTYWITNGAVSMGQLL